jgi:hypothetical protein
MTTPEDVPPLNLDSVVDTYYHQTSPFLSFSESKNLLQSPPPLSLDPSPSLRYARRPGATNVHSTSVPLLHKRTPSAGYPSSASSSSRPASSHPSPAISAADSHHSTHSSISSPNHVLRGVRDRKSLPACFSLLMPMSLSSSSSADSRSLSPTLRPFDHLRTAELVSLPPPLQVSPKTPPNLYSPPSADTPTPRSRGRSTRTRAPAESRSSSVFAPNEADLFDMGPREKHKPSHARRNSSPVKTKILMFTPVRSPGVAPLRTVKVWDGNVKERTDDIRVGEGEEEERGRSRTRGRG